jgi:hypothetical protein
MTSARRCFGKDHAGIGELRLVVERPNVGHDEDLDRPRSIAIAVISWPITGITWRVRKPAKCSVAKWKADAAQSPVHPGAFIRSGQNRNSGEAATTDQTAC